MTEYIYCAVNEQGEIQWVIGSSRRTRYFKTDKYLKGSVKYHNKVYPSDQWRIAKFQLVEVKQE